MSTPDVAEVGVCEGVRGDDEHSNCTRGEWVQSRERQQRYRPTGAPPALYLGVRSRKRESEKEQMNEKYEGGWE